MAGDNRDVLFSKASFGGYRPEEVDEYIDNMNVRMESQQNRIDELTEKMRYLVRVIEDMRAKTPSKSVDKANAEAERIIENARADADKIVAKARESAILIQKQAGNNYTAEKNLFLTRQKSVSDQSLAALREFTLQTMNNILEGCNEEAKKLEEMRDQLLSNIDSEEDRIQNEYNEQIAQKDAVEECATDTEEDRTETETSENEVAIPETATEEIDAETKESSAVEEVSSQEDAAVDETTLQEETLAGLFEEVVESKEIEESSEQKETEQEEPKTDTKDDLNLDEGGFAELREGINALAEEKYIPGQEEPTIVPASLQDVKVKQFVTNPQPQKPSVMPEIKSEQPKNEAEEEDEEEDIRFSFFHKK